MKLIHTALASRYLRSSTITILRSRGRLATVCKQVRTARGQLDQLVAELRLDLLVNGLADCRYGDIEGRVLERPNHACPVHPPGGARHSVRLSAGMQGGSKRTQANLPAAPCPRSSRSRPCQTPRRPSVARAPAVPSMPSRRGCVGAGMSWQGQVSVRVAIVIHPESLLMTSERSQRG